MHWMYDDMRVFTNFVRYNTLWLHKTMTLKNVMVFL